MQLPDEKRFGFTPITLGVNTIASELSKSSGGRNLSVEVLEEYNSRVQALLAGKKLQINTCASRVLIFR
jgi:hypothetical protein